MDAITGGLARLRLPHQLSSSSTTQPKCSLLLLPNELLEQVYNSLPPLARAALRMTCHVFREICNAEISCAIFKEFIDARDAMSAPSRSHMMFLEPAGGATYISVDLTRANIFDNLVNLEAITDWHMFGIRAEAFSMPRLTRLTLRIRTPASGSTRPNLDGISTLFQKRRFSALYAFILVDESSTSNGKTSWTNESIRALAGFIREHNKTLAILRLPPQWPLPTSSVRLSTRDTILGTNLETIGAHATLLATLFSTSNGSQLYSIRNVEYTWEELPKPGSDQKVFQLPDGVRVLRIAVQDKSRLTADRLRQIPGTVMRLYVDATSGWKFTEDILQSLCNHTNITFISVYTPSAKFSKSGKLKRFFITRGGGYVTSRCDIPASLFAQTLHNSSAEEYFMDMN